MNMHANTLGDVGPHDDPSYTGEQTSDSLPGMSMSYYRDKAREFQVLLNSLDVAYTSMIDSINSGLLPQDYCNDLLALAAEYESHKSILKITAEAVNAGAAIVNAAGGRMPQLSIPGTLGLGPIALPLGTIAAIGTIAALTAWGMSWLGGYNDRAKLQMTLDAQATPEGRAQVARDVQQSDAALKAADVTIFGALSGSVKWIALGVLGYFAYKYFNGHKLLK
jgi:hypothetical protein